MRPMITRLRTRAYQFSLRTGKPPGDVLGVLILTAVPPVLIVLLPLAVLPGVPLLVDNRPDLAISAVADDLGGTRVTVHGQASSELAAVLDAYLGSLPRLTLENLGGGPQG